MKKKKINNNEIIVVKTKTKERKKKKPGIISGSGWHDGTKCSAINLFYQVEQQQKNKQTNKPKRTAPLWQAKCSNI